MKFLCRVEDHDDLVPIFNRQSEMLVKTYGDYFLAELIEAQDEDMKCLVTEVLKRLRPTKTKLSICNIYFRLKEKPLVS